MYTCKHTYAHSGRALGAGRGSRGWALSLVRPQEEEEGEGEGANAGADREQQEAGGGEEARVGQADPGSGGLREDAGEAGRAAPPVLKPPLGFKNPSVAPGSNQPLVFFLQQMERILKKASKTHKQRVEVRQIIPISVHQHAFIRIVGLEEPFRLCETQKRGGRGSGGSMVVMAAPNIKCFFVSFSPLGLQQALGYSD